MLTDVVTLNDGTDDNTYALVSRTGMESIRRETTAGVPSREGSSLKISNTIDINNLAAKNRHLIQLYWKDDDADGVPAYEGSVHVVISRHKNVTDDKLKLKLAQLADLITDATAPGSILLGGN